MQYWFKIFKSINITNLISGLKDKHYMIISIDSEKAFDKNQYAFMIKFLEKVRPGRTYIKPIYDKPPTNVILNGEKLKSISLKSGRNEDFPLSLLIIITI